MIQIEFARNAGRVLETDDNVIGLAVGGSWLTGQIDEFSDLDLIVVMREKISDNKSKMIAYARRLGYFLTGFTGEHVGEPKVLICLYDKPLLHVDIKFVTLEEFEHRVESPFILLDKHGQLQSVIDNTPSTFPYPDYQWIEDRFWIWVHYALLKIGRGELFEALDFFGFLRMVVLGPLLHIKNGNLPRGVRKVETELSESDFNDLKITIPTYTRKSLLVSLRNSVSLYRKLRKSLFNDDVQLQIETEESVMLYFNEIESQN
ncbi:nucleotidyltransferase domain-containing protein [Arcticibacter tournemirensis]|uniref:Nucleotidyltransferase domain-containing protein n=1 Tax=Arcticibacter tournemirensis TaxID=699437 RepID=A0A4Q0MBS5_9SPHI|nr:nucleotidyltransferase domain-containing protein [Arcticibacter tournemirensis]RXF70615.1 nucleotidyltransferase domain-containing protein [Arcticibacter tournemirensis]